MKKKILLSMGLVTATISPLAFVTSCYIERKFRDNEDMGISSIYKDKYIRPFQFNEIKDRFGKGQPQMYKGLAFQAYSHGISFLLNLAIKLGFDINTGKTAKVSDIKYTSKTEDKKTAEFVFKMFNGATSDQTFSDSKSSGEVWIDPAGLNGNMDEGFFEYSGFGRYQFQDKKSFWDFEKGKPMDISEVKGKRWVLKNGFKYEYGVPKYFQYIDVDNPGTVILDMHVRDSNYTKGGLDTKEIPNKPKWNFNTHIKSPSNFYQKFTKITSKEKIEEFAELMYHVIWNMHTAFNNKEAEADLDMLALYVSPQIINFINFIKSIKLNFTNRDDKKKIIDEIKKMNNGSHNIFALELFARGIENLPKKYWPYKKVAGFYQFVRLQNVGDSDQLANIIGMANTSSSKNLQNWGFGTSKPVMDKDNKETFSKDESFDPNDSTTYYEGGQNWVTKSVVKRPGIITPVLGLMFNKIVYNKYVTFLGKKTLISSKNNQKLTTDIGSKSIGNTVSANELGIITKINPKKIKFIVTKVYSNGVIKVKIFLSESWNSQQEITLKWIEMKEISIENKV